MIDTQSYETVRRTTVRRIAPKATPERGPKGQWLPKFELAAPKPVETPKPAETPKPQPRIIARFEIIGDAHRTAELVLCDGIMPRQLAETVKRFVEAWYTA